MQEEGASLLSSFSSVLPERQLNSPALCALLLLSQVAPDILVVDLAA
jgi:hypothetical protein